MSEKISSIEWVLWSVTLFWGANYVVGKWGMAGFEPLTFNVLRFVIVTPILFVILFFFEHDMISVPKVIEIAAHFSTADFSKLVLPTYGWSFSQ